MPNAGGDQMAYLREVEEGRTEVASAPSPKQSWRSEAPAADQDDQSSVLKLEDVVGNVLRWGSLLSMAMILAGLAGVAWYARMATGPHLLLIPAVGTHNLNTLLNLITGIRSGDPTAIISLGLLALIITPVLRVASTVVYFFMKRDLTYLAITSFVLLVLVAGFLLGNTAG